MNVRMLIVCGLCIAACVVAPTTSVAEEPTIESPVELWQGFDPTAEPLEIESLETWEKDGARYEKLYFTGASLPAGKTRVFAIRGTPPGDQRVPGVLHIHGGGQTASQSWVEFWVSRGYACATFDFCGPWADRKEVTDWGPIVQGNMAQAAGGLQVKPTPRESSWYHWAAASRRALTLLADDPRVDDDRLGIFGISVGGTLCWLVAASDDRVKTAVPIYGCGYNYDRRKFAYGFPPPSADVRLYQQTLSPEAHAPEIKRPILFLDATNDFHGWLDHAFDILPATQSETRQSFTPRFNHHIAAEQGRNLPAWMDWQLRGGPAFPESPRITARIDEHGMPVCDVVLDQPAGVDRFEVWYALGDKPPPNRFWRKTVAVLHGADWSVATPVTDPWETVHAFANVVYRTGVSLSSPLVRFVPGQKGRARGTLAWSAAVAADESPAGGWTYMQAHTDPSIERDYLVGANDPERPSAVAINAALFGDEVNFIMGTHAIGDPQFAGPTGAELAFDVRGDFSPGPLVATVIMNDWTHQATRFEATVEPTGDVEGWRTVSLPLSAFKGPSGQSPAAWSDLDVLQVKGKAAKSAPPRFDRLRWHNRP